MALTGMKAAQASPAPWAPADAVDVRLLTMSDRGGRACMTATASLMRVLQDVRACSLQDFVPLTAKRPLKVVCHPVTHDPPLGARSVTIIIEGFLVSLLVRSPSLSR